MRRDGINYVVVGAFVLLMLGGSMAAFYVIAGRSGRMDAYHVYYRHVVGLQVGSPVYYEGFKVGQIEKIEPQQGREPEQRTDRAPDKATEPIAGRTRFRVDISVRHGWRIPADSVARMLASGLLSAITINIKEGVRDVDLPVGGELEGEEGGDIFRVMSDVAQDLNRLAESSLRPLLRNLNRQLTELSARVQESAPALLGQFGDLLAKLNGIADDLQDLVKAENRQSVEAMLGDLRDGSASAREVAERALRITSVAEGAVRDAARLSRDLNGTRARIDDVIGELHGSVGENRGDIRRAMVDLRHILDVAARHVDRVTYHLEGTSRNMHEFSRELRANPGLLLRDRGDDEELEGGP